MQISAEIQSPENKTEEINILGPTHTTYTWEKKAFTIVDMGKGKWINDQVLRFSAHQYINY